MVDLAIAIVNWNTKDLLKACLRSIFDQTRGLDYQVWVVDNASSDGSVEMVKGEFPQVRLIENMTNVGFTKANNQVLRQSRGKYVLLLNSDTQVIGNAIKELFDFMEAHPEAGAGGCQLLNRDGSFQSSCGRFPKLISIFFGGEVVNRFFKKIFKNRTFFAEYGLNEEDHHSFQNVDFVKGCCILLRKLALEKAGLLDENLFMYFEEMDLCYRIKQQGYKILYSPGPKVLHLGGQSSRFVGETVFRNLNSQAYLFRKHYGNAHVFALKWVVAAGSLIRVPIYFLIFTLATKEKRILIRPKLIWNLYALKWFARVLI
jgi:hypothetical protein